MSSGDLPLPLRLLASLVIRWVRSQRERLAPRGRPLTASERASLSSRFEGGTLERVRIVHAADAPLLGPAVLTARSLLVLTGMRGITLDDVVLVREPAAVPLPSGFLFHELVHVAQFELLGVETFLRLYLRGWSEGGYRYRGIPLERSAYGLQAAFEEGALDGCVNEILRTRLTSEG